MVQNVARKGKWYDNVAAALLGIKRSQGERVHTTDDDIVDALEQKYDALKEKVLLEVLKRYVEIIQVFSYSESLTVAL